MTRVEELVGGVRFKWAVVDIETKQIVSVYRNQVDAEDECLFLNQIATR